MISLIRYAIRRFGGTMKDKSIKIVAIVVITVSFLAIGFSSGVIIGSLIGRAPEKVSAAGSGVLSQIDFSELSNIGNADAEVDVETTEPEEMDMGPFWEAYEILKEFYVDQPLDNDALVEGAIEGMVKSLGDPHTRYSDAESYQAELAYMEGEEYEGIGAWVDLSGDYVRVTSPMRGSPAEAAGLRPRDLVIAIDGEDQTGEDLNLSLSKIKGPEGTKVVLTIKRGEEEPFDVEIIRARMTTPMVIWEMRDGDIAYIELTQFGESTVEELEKAIDELLPQEPKGIVLDLRNNGGGYVDACVSVAEEFLPKGSLVLIEKNGDGTLVDYKTRFTGQAQDIPMVVLGNDGTASASEILIGALQYYHRAIFVGTQTYGKGTMQIQPELSNGGAVSVTIARWLTSGGDSIHDAGITPDIVVERTEEDYKNEIDAQYNKAVELLRQGVKPEDLEPIPAPAGGETDGLPDEGSEL